MEIVLVEQVLFFLGSAKHDLGCVIKGCQEICSKYYNWVSCICGAKEVCDYFSRMGKNAMNVKWPFPCLKFSKFGELLCKNRI